MPHDAPQHSLLDARDLNVLIAPPGGWKQRLRGTERSDRQRRFREQLGLAVDRPVVMSGHQATVWHPGILAKWLAASHAAAALGAAAAWVVVDTDPEDFTTIRLPVRGPGRSGAGRIEARAWRIASEEIAQLLAADHPPCMIPPFPVRPPPAPADLGGEPALPGVAAGVAAISRALSAAGTEADSAGAQLTGAVVTLTADLVPPPMVIRASHLSTTTLFGELVERIAREPAGCIDAYNAATAAHPRERVAPLAVTASRLELPLWHLDPATRTRRRVWSDRLASIPRVQLAPRALLLTAILRLAGCDLFIHGTGGGGGAGPDARSGAPGRFGYDAITTEWMVRWLGEALAPMVTVSADVLLPLAAAPVPTEAEAARARWLAHHARHDPGQLGDAALASVKREALAAIAATRDRAHRARHFRELHAALDRARGAAASRLADLDAKAARVGEAASSGRIALDRTWAFPLHDGATLRRLSEAVRAHMA